MKRFVTTMVIVGVVSAGLSADQGTAKPAGRSFRPLWTFVGIGAGFGTGVWAGFRAFDDSINSERKIWTCAIAGAAAGGVIGYLFDRRRATSRVTPQPRVLPVMHPHDARALTAMAGHLGDGQLKRWLEAAAPFGSKSGGGKVFSIE